MKISTRVKLVALGLFLGAFVIPVSQLGVWIVIIISGMFACCGFVCEVVEERKNEKGI